MIVSRSRIPTALALFIGLFAGLGPGEFPPRAACTPAPATARAKRSWRPDRCSSASTRPPKAPSRSTPFTFSTTREGGCWRQSRATSKPNTSTRLIEPFSERDLVADFKLDLDAGPRPRFLMTTGSLGPNNAGWAPLYVFETTTSQIGVYRMQIQQTIGITSRPRFELVELRSYAKGPGTTSRP